MIQIQELPLSQSDDPCVASSRSPQASGVRSSNSSRCSYWAAWLGGALGAPLNANEQVMLLLATPRKPLEFLPPNTQPTSFLHSANPLSHLPIHAGIVHYELRLPVHLNLAIGIHQALAFTSVPLPSDDLDKLKLHNHSWPFLSACPPFYPQEAPNFCPLSFSLFPVHTSRDDLRIFTTI